LPTPASSFDNGGGRQSGLAAEASQVASAPKRRCYLGLGSNLGAKARNLAAALSLLARRPGLSLQRVSSVYRTRPVGLPHQPDFLNLVASVDSELSPTDLLKAALYAEKQLGRVRTVRWGPRTVDVDILLIDQLQIAEPSLTVPHPRLRERQFVLTPLAEIAPDLELPGGDIVQDLAEGESRAVCRVGRLAALVARKLEAGEPGD